MNAFDRLERQVRDAAARPRRRRAWWRTPVLCGGAVIALGGAALAAQGTLPIGHSVGWQSDPKPDPKRLAGVAEPDSVRLLSLRVPDPAGGPPWALRVFATNRGGSCIQLGQVYRGRFGVIEPSFTPPYKDEFRPLQTHGGTQSLCSGASAAGFPVLRGVRRLVRREGQRSVRVIRYGLLGPQATEARYLDDRGKRAATQRLTATDGGAYLFAIGVDSIPKRKTLDAVEATFATGETIRVAGHGRQSTALPGVPRRTAPPVSTLKTKVTVHPKPHRVDVRFDSPVAIRRFDEGYRVTLSAPKGCPSATDHGFAAPANRDYERGERVRLQIPLGVKPCRGAYEVVVRHHSGAGDRLVGTARFTV